jgi:hypothetical protein
MRRLPLVFFTTAVLCGLFGMGWGMLMARSEDFAMAPAHAHLNLLGWVSLSLMGGFYALAGERAPTRIGWVNYGLSTIGLAIMIPALARLLDGDKAARPVVAAASGIVFLGMFTFLIAVLSLWRAPKTV